MVNKMYMDGLYDMIRACMTRYDKSFLTESDRGMLTPSLHAVKLLNV